MTAIAERPDLKPEFKADPKSDCKDDLKSLPMPELQKKLGSTPDGLSQAEAEKRLTRYGLNEITEKKTNQVLKFLSYFWGPIPWMIEGAVILSALVQHWLDFFIILLLLCSNAVVGFWEEHQAGNAIAALKARLAILAKVKRDGKWQNPKASELVPGDVIRLRLGDIVPADARLLDGDPIEVDQFRINWRVIACNCQARFCCVLRIDRPSGRNRRHGVCHRNEYLLWQNRPDGARGEYRKPFPNGSLENRRLPDRAGGSAGRVDSDCRAFPRRQGSHYAGILPRAPGCRDPGSHAHGSSPHCVSSPHSSRLQRISLIISAFR